MDAITTLPVSFTLPSRFGTHSNGSVLPLFFRHQTCRPFMEKSSLIEPVSAQVSVCEPPSVWPSRKLSLSSVSVEGSNAVLMTSALKSCSLPDAPIFRLPGPSVRVFAMIVFLSVDFEWVQGDFVGR